MEQDDPAEALTELRERQPSPLELLQVAAGSGLAVYGVWALLLQPGFRRVPLRLQVRGRGAAGRRWPGGPGWGGALSAGVRPRVLLRRTWRGCGVGLVSSGSRQPSPREEALEAGPILTAPPSASRCPMSARVPGRWSTCCRCCEAVLGRLWTWALGTAGL